MQLTATTERGNAQLRFQPADMSLVVHSPHRDQLVARATLVPGWPWCSHVRLIGKMYHVTTKRPAISFGQMLRADTKWSSYACMHLAGQGVKRRSNQANVAPADAACGSTGRHPLLSDAPALPFKGLKVSPNISIRSSYRWPFKRYHACHHRMPAAGLEVRFSAFHAHLSVSHSVKRAMHIRIMDA